MDANQKQSDLLEPKIIETANKSPVAERKQRTSTNANDRLKPPQKERNNNSTRLKFKHDQSNEKDKVKKGERSKKEDVQNRKSSVGVSEETKVPATMTVAAQKASSSRLAQSKTLFKKNSNHATSKFEPPKSVETKEPTGLKQMQSQDLQVWSQPVSEKPKENMPIVNESPSQGTKDNGLENSMYDDQESSFVEKNSIAEFEMLEKECF